MRGKLVIIGGKEDKNNKCLILKKFLELSGGEDACIVILTSATDEPEKIGAAYCQVFNSLGCTKVHILDIPSRIAAGSKEIGVLINRATGVFFTGGDQLKITSALGGTDLMKNLKNKFSQGLVIAGTSAGASAMSSTMIIEGEGDESPQFDNIRMAPGIGLLSDVVIDQHFAQRGRIGRLLMAVGQNPAVLGLGIDEDTAVIIDQDELLVWGSQTVTILDGWKVTHTNVSSLKPEQNLTLMNVKLHTLSHGYSFNLKSRQPQIQRQEEKD